MDPDGFVLVPNGSSFNTDVMDLDVVGKETRGFGSPSSVHAQPIPGMTGSSSRRGPGVGQNNSDNSPVEPYFLSSSPSSPYGPPIQNTTPTELPFDWFQIVSYSPPRITPTQLSPPVDRNFPPDTSPYMVDDIDNRAPVNNPDNHGVAPVIIRNLQDGHPVGPPPGPQQPAPGLQIPG